MSILIQVSGTTEDQCKEKHQSLLDLGYFRQEEPIVSKETVNYYHYTSYLAVNDNKAYLKHQLELAQKAYDDYAISA